MPKWNQIQSKVDAIDKLRIFALPPRPIDVAKAVRTNRTIVVVDKAGRVYSSEANVTMFWSTTRRLENTIDCLIKMKLLSAAAVRQHKEAAAVEEAAKSRRWASDSILENAERAGIKLTAAQARQLTAQSSSVHHAGDDA